MKDRLKSPGSAKFPGMFEQTYTEAVTSLGSGRYLVRSWVDAQNTFGALMRIDYVCQVQNTGGDSWQLIDLQASER